MEHDLKKSIIVYPTDTVWAIGCSIFDEALCKSVRKIKKSNTNKPLTILFGDIQTVQEYFSLPIQRDDPWWEEFFSLELTLGLPIKYIKKEIPQWILCKSDLVCFRLLPSLRSLCEKSGPLISTSLNLSSESPITNKEKAHNFFINHTSKGYFFDKVTFNSSGNPSSIVKIENSKLSFLREGSYAQKIQYQFGLLKCC